MAAGTTHLDISELTKAMFDDMPTGELLQALESKMRTIYDKLEGEPLRDALLDDIASRDRKNTNAIANAAKNHASRKNNYYLTKAAVVLAIDWETLSRKDVFDYLAGGFSKEINLISDSLTEALLHSPSKVNDAIFVQEQSITYDISSPRRTTSFSELLKREVPVRRAADERIAKEIAEAERDRNLGQTGFALQDTTKVNALWSLPPGRVVTEKEQRAKITENARRVVEQWHRAKWSGSEDAFLKNLEENKEQFEAEVEAQIQKELITYIRRDEVRIYMLEWKWHFDERVADRMYKLLQTMASLEHSPTLLAPDALLFREIQHDLGAAYPKDLKDPAEGFIALVSTYVAMDEIRQCLADPISSMDDYHESMEIGKHGDLRRPMKALFVQDQGFTLLQKCAEIEDLEAARLANVSERHALHYFKTGTMPEGINNLTTDITFAELDASVKRLAISYYTKNPDHAQVEKAFLKDLEKLQGQLGDFLSEKFYLVDKQLGFHGITGRVAHLANSFLSEENKKKLKDDPLQAQNPVLETIITASAAALVGLDFLSRVLNPAHRNTPNPAKLLEVASRAHEPGSHATRILEQRAVAAGEIKLQ